MSDFRAIGGVSVSLKTLLEDRMELPGSQNNLSKIPATISTPGSEQKEDGDEDGQDTTTPRINLFLYRVTENGYLKNQEIPGRGVPGAYGHPPLSLDLHYVLTAYGSTMVGESVDERVAHYLLGNAMRVLHDYPVITKQLRTVKPPVGEQILDQSLTEEFEQVKLYLDPISLEDLSKVWTALMLSYRLSVAYKVTVVQIESQRTRRFPKPVGEPPPGGPRVYAVPFRSPQIQELRVRRAGDPPDVERPFPYARIGDTPVIRGRNFGREHVRVLLGGLAVPATPLSDDRIELSIPDDRLPDGTVIPEERRLQPGAQPVSVALGVPELPQTGFHSNQAVFMLVPLVASPDPNLPSLDPNLTAAPRTLTIRGKRLFLGSLSGETLVGPALIGKNSYMNPSTTEITVPLPDTLPARLVHCVVSGNLSPFPPDLSSPPLDIQVEIDNEGPHPATLMEKPTVESAARILQAAIRSAPEESPAFKDARVTTAITTEDTTEDIRLVVVPGGLFGKVAISGDVANRLKLSTDQQAPPNARAEQVEGAYLSGELAPFPVLTAAQPSLRVTIDNTAHTVRLASRPTTLASAADELQKAIKQAAGPGETGFSEARMTVLGNQLLILPGAPKEPTNVEGVPVGDPVVPGGDQTTVAELQLRARYPVRVRVNGAENISDESLEVLEMPP